MIENDVLLKGFRTMSLIRAAEEAIARDFRDNKIFSFLHLSIGQEAVAAGVCLALDDNDRVFGNHRSHGHYLAKGGDLYAMLAEVYGKATGCCKGKGGSMHMLDRSVGFAGSTPIMGSAVPIAAGSAFEQKQHTDDDLATAVFFGDGASEEGVVYETINLAALWKLPLLMVVENNLFAVNSPLHARRGPGYHLGAICSGLGMRHVPVDGNDFRKVYEATRELRKHTHSGGPTVIEARVYREMAHSGPICDESVRSEDVKAERERQDPILILRNVLLACGFKAKELDELQEKEINDVALAMEMTRRAAMPSEIELMDGIYL